MELREEGLLSFRLARCIYIEVAPPALCELCPLLLWHVRPMPQRLEHVINADEHLTDTSVDVRWRNLTRRALVEVRIERDGWQLVAHVDTDDEFSENLVDLAHIKRVDAVVGWYQVHGEVLREGEHLGDEAERKF